MDEDKVNELLVKKKQRFENGALIKDRKERH